MNRAEEGRGGPPRPLPRTERCRRHGASCCKAGRQSVRTALSSRPPIASQPQSLLQPRPEQPHTALSRKPAHAPPGARIASQAAPVAMLVAGRPVTQLLSLQTLQRGELRGSAPPLRPASVGVCARNACGRPSFSNTSRLPARRRLPPLCCTVHPAQSSPIQATLQPIPSQAWPACPRRCARGSTS